MNRRKTLLVTTAIVGALGAVGTATVLATTAGATDEQVMRFVHDRYGDFVLLRPPLRASTIILWAMPAIALGGGMLMILAMRRRAARAAMEPAALSAEEQARLDRLARDG